MFQTKVKLEKSPYPISLDDCILTVGSCFSEYMGAKLSENKFKTSTNPFGVLFNPISIFKLVNQAAVNDLIKSMGIVENQGIFHHFDLHSDLSRLNKSELLRNANERMQRLTGHLQESSLIIYTFGTSIVYELLETGEIVANCHKVPASKFHRRFLEISEIIHAFKVNYDLVKSVKKDIRFILTLSPVRHQKESFEQNNVSKSILRVAIEKIVGEFDNVEYFPAFEVMMDELRDYRFYAEDMLHPNQVAIDYIWQKFMDVYFDEQTSDFVADWSKMRKSFAHRPFNPEGYQHQEFIKKTIDRLHEFSKRVDVESELKKLKSQLNESSAKAK
jgi:hypothetical protein